MEAYWQSILVMVLVGLAVVYLVVSQTRRRKAKRACSSCPVVNANRRSR